ncbi:hypothetical protein SPSYN_02912 [Sporotomaculum syntrophicum]|uniref:Uncharacterized protein n=1 Tax=Sporotomaculum syntrophicum TaxID=182264 RepID=A0A9D2WM95_9FIRM|nr:hypothetical protein [Sporotomaculum syntrophicum]KAF1084000.1 hypothetical protein SPSYN_02912 [Sporotomaculum syntrophicum]
MKKLIDRLLNAARKYNVFDFACFKIALFSCGILVGGYFPQLFIKFSPIIWLIFVTTYAWVIYKTIKYIDVH